MKKLAFVVLLLSGCCFAASKPNPTDYTIQIHINGSEVKHPATGCEQVLNVTIDGLHYGLTGGCDRNADYSWLLLMPGDYKARLVDNATTPNFRVMRSYELLFPDGSKRKFFTFSVSE